MGHAPREPFILGARTNRRRSLLVPITTSLPETPRTSDEESKKQYCTPQKAVEALEKEQIRRTSHTGANRFRSHSTLPDILPRGPCRRGEAKGRLRGHGGGTPMRTSGKEALAQRR